MVTHEFVHQLREMGQQMNHQQKDHDKNDVYKQNLIAIILLLSIIIIIQCHGYYRCKHIIIVTYSDDSTICPFGYDTVLVV